MKKNSSNILIYHTEITPLSAPDDLDVLEEAKFVSKNLVDLGYNVTQRPFVYKPNLISFQLDKHEPQLIFNLVEAIDGTDSLAYLAPELFELLGKKYTGCSYSAFKSTSSKVESKKIMQENSIPTPYFLTAGNFENFNFQNKRFLVKSNLDHASKGLEEFLIDTPEVLKEKLVSKPGFFAEEYIEGREFNISCMGSLKNCQILPIAEMKFRNWPADQLRIVSYEAKWDEDSKKSKDTVRSFDYTEEDKKLLTDLTEICKECWNIFDLKGYARIDFRVDENNNPYVLEINANPCISPDAGFIAATEKAGMTSQEVIKKILESA